MAQTALKAAEASATHGGAMPSGAPLPLGRRVPSGRLRWYFVSCPEGCERAACDRIVRLLPDALVEDAFVPRRECFVKKAGVWSLRLLPMWRGYAVVVSPDAAALKKALLAADSMGSPVGASGTGWTPLSRGAQEWLASVMDEGHVVRASVGRIDADGLHVEHGPLAGRESAVVKIDRHHRQCWARVCGVNVRMPLEVPVKVSSRNGDADGAFCERACSSSPSRVRGACV